nr:hypothetical protein CPGR_06017 [Mycolicibacterium fortuitum subsp. fortuitum DSM 46621 = ATCC 6841 = JCM 6387]CRL82841.1 hypothetical protein CPGR_06068 [Mycolicibacter nonchromogenicus]
MLRNLSQQIGPPGERGAGIGQCHRLPVAMLNPGDVEVLQEDSPRHSVDGQMVNDQHQLTHRCHPQRADHHPGGRVQPRPSAHECLVRQHVDCAQAAGRVGRTCAGNGEGPAACVVVPGAQPEHAVSVEQGLQEVCDIIRRCTGWGLQHDRLVELVDRPLESLQALQPMHDRGRCNRPQACVDGPVRYAGGLDHLSETGHGLLDEDVAWPAHQARRAGA